MIGIGTRKGTLEGSLEGILKRDPNLENYPKSTLIETLEKPL